MQKILVVNRGEIAIRIIRACQELGIKTVAIHSMADNGALHTKLADESICVGPGPSVRSYLNIPQVMSAAEISGVDGVHPGYGFLAESAEFARICAAHNIKFIGPTSEQIRALGDKVEAREIATSAGLPLLPGSTGSVDSVQSGCDLASEIGYPVIIKAAAGGGGRGMKIVTRREDFANQFAIAQSEAAAYFGSKHCFVEKYLANPRHVEVQLVGDEHGNLVALGERDCSVQRRHQKLIEESPCPVLTPEQRAEVCEHALNLARAVGYQSLGTVEFLYQDGRFYFMEMNTRVQVEHPVTEMVTDVDLLKEQILIAQGEKLPETLFQVKSSGHSLECRINAEDPETFAPCPGTVTAYHEPGGPGVRIDSMLYNGYKVPALYDSMLAKVITYGRDRDECLARMRRVLREMRVDGIKTNIALHLKIIEDEAFQKSEISTKYLECLLN